MRNCLSTFSYDRYRDLQTAVVWIWDPVLLYPWIRDGKKPDLGSGMNIPYHISESIVTFFLVENTFIGTDPDVGYGIFSNLDQDPEWKNSDPGTGKNIPDPQN
jgi:hypothetical protein